MIALANQCIHVHMFLEIPETHACTPTRTHMHTPQTCMHTSMHMHVHTHINSLNQLLKKAEQYFRINIHPNQTKEL